MTSHAPAQATNSNQSLKDKAVNCEVVLDRKAGQTI